MTKHVACALVWASVAAIVWGSLGARPVGAAEDQAAIDQSLAEAGVAFLKTYCHRCHGVDFEYPGLDMLDRATLVQPKDSSEAPFLSPGKPDESRLWKRLAAKEMPPEEQPQPSDAERQTLRRWIEAGAHFPAPQRPQREFLGEDTVLEAILTDLERAPRDVRRFTRYFSLAHLWNNPDISNDQLRIERAAVSKLINSLSLRPAIAIPREVGPDGTILAIDLRDYGWDERQQWNRLLKEYPYGLLRNNDAAERVADLTGADLPYVRADWFVHAASRPPLYHDLLGLPTNARDLERQLQVDIRRNFETARLLRAAFAKSGVSKQNRLVERHEISQGAYWKSYDFATNRERGNLFRFPLGPKFAGTADPSAFEHDGGEIIFNLPNGLQAYLLVKSDDARIDEGPIAIVDDPNHFSGAPTIVNGISCMGCHKHGMIKFADTLRETFLPRRGQTTADKVLRLYPPVEEMNKRVQADQDRFLAALEQALGPFLREGPDDARKIAELPEPITLAARLYDRRLSVADAARELGLPESPETAQRHNLPTIEQFAAIARFTSTMRNQRVNPLGHGESVGRDVWEAAFQRVARELGLGIPIEF